MFTSGRYCPFSAMYRNVAHHDNYKQYVFRQLGRCPDSRIKKIRRDTHDNAVPEEVFQLLENTMSRCPHLKYVVMEQLGTALDTEESRQIFYADFGRMERIVQAKGKNNNTLLHQAFLPLSPIVTGAVVENETLHQQQLELSEILETTTSHQEAIHRLNHSSLADSDWHIENWEPYMIATAISIAQKWKK